MKRSRNVAAGVVLGGMLGGVTLGSVLRQASAGTGDPPVIVLPSAKAAAMRLTAKPDLVQVQATTLPKSPVPPAMELLPFPQTAEPPRAVKSAPPVAPPLLVAPEQPLRPAPAVPTVTLKEAASPPPVVVREVAPIPRNDSATAKTVEVLPPPATGPIPSALAPPGDTSMKSATAAALTAMIATGPVAAETPVIEKITDYAKSQDVATLKGEVEALRKQLTALTGTAAALSRATDVKSLNDEIIALKKAIAESSTSQVKADDVTALKGELEALKKEILAKSAEHAKAADVKALKDEIALLKKEITGTTVDQAKAADVKTLKDEIVGLKKDIAALAVKPADGKGMKDELDALRTDVATLNTYLRETLEGKVDRGFTHDGVVKRLQKLDESIESLSKKVATLDSREPRTAGSSPLTRGPDAMPKNQGTVQIVNGYPIEIAIVINGVSHRLEPNTKKDVSVPTGRFKYQLLTSGGAETERSIQQSETVTLTIK